MAHTYVAMYVHVVFSTKNRERLISSEMEPRLHSYIGGIARKHGMKVLAIGGMLDHVHVLLSLPSTLTLAEAVQALKGTSSKWIHDTFGEQRRFAWQQAYGAFSIGVSQVPATVKYIEEQKQHHQRAGFDAEFVAFLKKHGIAYDPRYVFG